MLDVNIKGEAKEIATLVLAMQAQWNSDDLEPSFDSDHPAQALNEQAYIHELAEKTATLEVQVQELQQKCEDRTEMARQNAMDALVSQIEHLQDLDVQGVADVQENARCIGELCQLFVAMRSQR